MTTTLAMDDDRQVTDSVGVVASVLPADFSKLGEELSLLAAAGVDRIQWDVMDGVFVPNLTVGPDVIASCRSGCDTMFEAHLMVADPDPMLERYVAAGCEVVIVHAEACRHLHRTLGAIRDMGALAGVALNPATPLEAVLHVLDMVDHLLIMTVNPGFGGQGYLSTMEPKIRQAADAIAASGRTIGLEVDGGISPATVAGAVAAGARLLVAGSALFGESGREASVDALRQAAGRP